LETHVEDPDEDTKLCDRVKCNAAMWRMDTVEGLCQVTFLSRKQAEAYILVSEDHRDLSILEAAEEMSISEGNLKGKMGEIRDKITMGEATAKLSL
jgi:predicted DNA-binding protein (UPF0251 family)